MNKLIFILIILFWGNTVAFAQKTVKYQSPDGIVSAKLQKQPDLIHQKLATNDSAITLHIIYSETDFATQMISYYRYPAKKGETLDASKKSKIINDAGEKFAQSMKLKVDKREHVNWLGQDCIETYGYDHNSGITHRILMIKEYVFQIVISKPSGMASDKELKAFFGKIKIHKKKL